ncbi:sigma-70 family RNA polymerase sigma factor [Brevibacillus laterosporus]|uniref:sigma-70 family RNA polymerase sigma factor n=1 Tax=Brevibacillus laterosporus TaxID=1465 RepID=UPI003D213B61
MTTQNSLFNLQELQPIFDFELYKVRNQDREDVKQTAILRILDALNNPRYKVTSDSLFRFSHLIVKRTVVDYYRGVGRMIEQYTTSVHYCDGNNDNELDDGNEYFAVEVPDNGYSVADIRLDYRLNKNEFTPQQSKIIELYLSDDGLGMSMIDVTRKLGMNKSHGSRALQKLKEVCTAC